MQIIRARSDDAAVLTSIAFAAKRHWGYTDRQMKLWRDALTITADFLVTHEASMAVADDQMVGFHALVQKPEELELAHLWVLPDWMGRGIGRALFDHGVARARELEYRQIKIESDPNAEGFYLRMGARRSGTNITELEGRRRELPVLIFNVIL